MSQTSTVGGENSLPTTAIIAWVDRSVWTRRLPPEVGARQRRACIDVLTFGFGQSLHGEALSRQDAQRISADYARTGATTTHRHTARLFLETHDAALQERPSEAVRPPMVPTGNDIVRAIEEAYSLGEISGSRRA